MDGTEPKPNSDGEPAPATCPADSHVRTDLPDPLAVLAGCAGDIVRSAWSVASAALALASVRVQNALVLVVLLLTAWLVITATAVVGVGYAVSGVARLIGWASGLPWLGDLLAGVGLLLTLGLLAIVARYAMQRRAYLRALNRFNDDAHGSQE